MVALVLGRLSQLVSRASNGYLWATILTLVECIAHLLKKPLMILTTTDIGTSPDLVEKNLTRTFETAKSWDAVLLIDEADVFIANRSVGDLHRSSLVAST
jgi:hypothetical protein